MPTIRRFVPAGICALACILPACKPAQPHGPDDAITVEAADASAPPAASTQPMPQPGTVAGAWEGQPCESRKYVRKIGFDRDNTFSATDLVSPCPPGAKCVWSGIILWKGAWKQVGSRIQLDPDRSGRLPEKVPDALTLSADVLVEAGDPTCRYSPQR